MVRCPLHRIMSSLVIAALMAITTGCMAGLNANGHDDDKHPKCDENCVQPPLLRTDLVDHLQRNQDRILARDNYKNNLPTPVSELIYGVLPDQPQRGGPPIDEAHSAGLIDELNWHYVEFDSVTTDGVDHRSLRGREASGAHCYFAHRPNRYTAIFSLVVLHHRDRGDILYQGGPYHRINRIDTVPITDRYKSRIRVDTEHLWCVFRGDQNRMGALVIPFRYIDVNSDSDTLHYAVFTVTTAVDKKPTGHHRTIERPAGTRSRETVEEQVPIKKYPNPRFEFVEVFDTPIDALLAAQKSIPAGRFRLRPEFIYPSMTYKSHLNTEAREFCPIYTQCTEAREHFDADIFPPLPDIDDPEDRDEDTPEQLQQDAQRTSE